MKCTHIALQANRLAETTAFYEHFCGMQVVHRRTRDHGTGEVVWLGWGEDPPTFVIVLIEQPYTTNTQPPWQHIGMAVDARAEVDTIHQRALDAGLTDVWPPVDAGDVVGYYCGVRDPEGNMVEFSYGQRLG